MVRNPLLESIMISMFKKLFTKDRKPKFSKGDQVTNGSVTVFII